MQTERYYFLQPVRDKCHRLTGPGYRKTTLYAVLQFACAAVRYINRFDYDFIFK